MAGETEEKVSAWTTDTLRLHVLAMLSESDKRYEQRFIAQQEAIQAALLAQKEAVNAALVAADRAVIKAELAAEKRFEAVNEFRATLADQAATLMPRAEAEARIGAMAEKLSEISDRVNRSEGNGTGLASAGSILVAVLGVAFGAAGIALALLK